jgi:hypothetical protein
MDDRLERFKKSILASTKIRAFVADHGQQDRTMRATSFVLAAAATLTMALAATLAITLVPGAAVAADDITITIKDHKFTPAEVRIPANKRMSIVVVNNDPTPEEFESLPMKIEKIIPGNSKALVRFGPIAPGRYEFIGEFNQATAKGVMIAE